MSKINIELQTLGEAHLYVAITKADGNVSKDERAFAPFYAMKSQKLFNILGINKKIQSAIKPAIEEIMDSSKYDSWDKDMHLDKAIELFKESNSPGLELIDPKNESGFLSVAKLDGYLMKESRFLTRMKEELAKLQ